MGEREQEVAGVDQAGAGPDCEATWADKNLGQW